MINGISDFITAYNTWQEQAKQDGGEVGRLMTERQFHAMNKIDEEMSNFLAETKGKEVDRSLDAKFERWTQRGTLEQLNDWFDESLKENVYRVIPEFESDGKTLKTYQMEIYGHGKYDIGIEGDQLSDELASVLLQKGIGVNLEQIYGTYSITPQYGKDGKTIQTYYMEMNGINGYSKIDLGPSGNKTMMPDLTVLNLREKAKTMNSMLLRVSNMDVFDLLVDRASL